MQYHCYPTNSRDRWNVAVKRASNYFQTLRDYSERSRKHAAALVRGGWGYPRFRTKIEICQNPIFIIGSPRSGTSALGWALGEHSQLATLVESSILAVLFQGRYAEKAYETAKARRNGRDWVMRYNVSRSEFVGYLGAGLNALMASRCPGKRWIEHTPHNTLMVTTMAELFPGAFFLHILRDGRKVVHSMVHFETLLGAEATAEQKSSGLLPAWATDFSAACKAWRNYVETAMHFCEMHPSRSMTVVNDELSADPDKQFGLILDRLGLPYEQPVADFFRTSRINSSFPQAPREPRENHQFSDPWQQWTDEARAIFTEEAGPTMVKYGLATEGGFKLR
jgi:Sulfotransferase family